MTKTARIYGDSLYDLAVLESLAEPILTDAQAVEELFMANPDYLRLLGEHSVPKKNRIALLDEAFGGRIEGYLLNFIKILCENGLLAEYAGCVEAYRERYFRDHGIADATVVSAVALSPAQADALKAKLEAMSGKQIVLKQVVSPAVVGGLKVELEGKLIDGTLAGRMEAMHRQLAAADQ